MHGHVGSRPERHVVSGPVRRIRPDVRVVVGEIVKFHVRRAGASLARHSLFVARGGFFVFELGSSRLTLPHESVKLGDGFKIPAFNRDSADDLLRLNSALRGPKAPTCPACILRETQHSTETAQAIYYF